MRTPFFFRKAFSATRPRSARMGRPCLFLMRLALKFFVFSRVYRVLFFSSARSVCFLKASPVILRIGTRRSFGTGSGPYLPSEAVPRRPYDSKTITPEGAPRKWARDFGPEKVPTRKIGLDRRCVVSFTANAKFLRLTLDWENRPKLKLQRPLRRQTPIIFHSIEGLFDVEWRSLNLESSGALVT